MGSLLLANNCIVLRSHPTVDALRQAIAYAPKALLTVSTILLMVGMLSMMRFKALIAFLVRFELLFHFAAMNQ